MRIALIGSGIAGLTAADRLRHRHDVVLFEANNYVGGHTHTVDVEHDGERHAIDTGFIVFNSRTYPHFEALLNELGVASRPTTMSFSVRCDRTGLEYCGSSLRGLFAQPINLFRPRFHRLLRDILRFNREAPKILDQQGDRRIEASTVAEYVSRERYSQEFAERYLLPMGAAIWSCPIETFGAFPIRFVVEFYQNHGLLAIRDRPVWRVVDGGSRTYVEALLKRFGARVDVRLNSPVHCVRRSAHAVEIALRGRPPESFDHVVFACHADQALRMLADPTTAEREILNAFPYQRNVAVLHTDISTLPRSRHAWASWNYHIGKHANGRATVTYCMNILQQLKSRHIFNVTLNGENDIPPERVLGSFVYEHPVFTLERDAAQRRHGELLNANRSSY